jgi:uncharacterized phage protein (TIGR02218 family)
MSRNVPAGLAERFKVGGTTQCALLQVRPTRMPAFGITSLDIDVTYDDRGPLGALTYRAKNGFTPSDQVAAMDLSVDNAEASSLLAQFTFDGMTAESIERGEYDGAAFTLYLVDYQDLAAGHIILSSGTVGQVRRADTGAVTIELRSYLQALKQRAMVEVTSISCRATFGDERCKMPFVWVDGEVTEIGPEDDRTFKVSALPDDFVVPGIIAWESGDAEGREYEIEDYDPDTGMLTLVFPTYLPIQVGDTLKSRRDCDKSKDMCKGYLNLLNMRSEADMPRANGTDLQAPGGSTGGGGGSGK